MGVFYWQLLGIIVCVVALLVMGRDLQLVLRNVERDRRRDRLRRRAWAEMRRGVPPRVGIAATCQRVIWALEDLGKAFAGGER